MTGIYTLYRVCGCDEENSNSECKCLDTWDSILNFDRKHLILGRSCSSSLLRDDTLEHPSSV